MALSELIRPALQQLGIFVYVMLVDLFTHLCSNLRWSASHNPTALDVTYVPMGATLELVYAPPVDVPTPATVRMIRVPFETFTIYVWIFFAAVQGP